MGTVDKMLITEFQSVKYKKGTLRLFEKNLNKETKNTTFIQYQTILKNTQQSEIYLQKYMVVGRIIFVLHR